MFFGSWVNDEQREREKERLKGREIDGTNPIPNIKNPLFSLRKADANMLAAYFANTLTPQTSSPL